MANKYYDVVIPRRLVTKSRNKNGKYYWLVLIPQTTKEVYIPFKWLKRSTDGKVYKGTWPENKELIGRERNTIKLITSDIKGIFPSKLGINVIANKKAISEGK